MSYAAKETEHEAYIDLLLKEAGYRRGEAGEPIRTVYIGGGTPSLLSPFLFRKLTDGLRGIYGFEHVVEFTSEANPGTVSAEWLDAAAEAGVNRLSVGMQAYQQSILDLLGRIHRFQDVSDTVRLSRLSGISNISLDLIFGIPGQTMNDWKETLVAALSLQPEHISAYGLIPEEGTPIFDDLNNARISLPDTDTEREMYSYTVDTLRIHGYHQYEISNFAKDGYECLHNKGYWTQVPYIGLGVSAASMIHLRTGKDGMTCERRVNPESMDAYINLIGSDLSDVPAEQIGPDEARFETMMLGLRMNAGVSEKKFAEMHGIPLEDCFGSRLAHFEQKGLMIHENGRWRLTERGFDIQNSILVELMD